MTVACIVLAAGKGTRMKSETPKVLHAVLGRPLFAWPIEAALTLEANPVVCVTGHGRELVDAALVSAFGDVVRCVHQLEQKGTGHAAQIGMTALEGFSGTVLILYGDTPLITAESLRALIDAREQAGAPLAMWTTRIADPTGYGRIVRDDKGQVTAIVEHKDADETVRAIDEINPGMYAVDAAFLRDALAGLSSDNAQGELYLTDIVARAAQQGAVPTVEVSAEETLGVNDRVQLAEAGQVLRHRINQRHMKNGVTMWDPARVVIEAGVEIGPDTSLAVDVTLRGRTRIGRGVTVMPGAVLTDTVVDDGATIHAYSVCEDAHMGAGAQLGPFGRLRPEAVLEEGAKVGNFVEVKKARLGKGAKANHLAYIGDADVGPDCNIGAGTITCNYDGFGKNLTVLGEGVFIGSNSTLVAPVTIAARAYVGAGSTVAQDVPEGSLAIGRARQENKAGYADRIRKRYQARKKRIADEKAGRS